VLYVALPVERRVLARLGWGGETGGLFEHSLVLLNALGDFPLEIFIEGISHISKVKKKKIVPESPLRTKHERIEGRVFKPLLIQ